MIVLLGKMHRSEGRVRVTLAEQYPARARSVCILNA
jgi:hypothetical protein